MTAWEAAKARGIAPGGIYTLLQRWGVTTRVIDRRVYVDRASFGEASAAHAARPGSRRVRARPAARSVGNSEGEELLNTAQVCECFPGLRSADVLALIKRGDLPERMHKGIYVLPVSVLDEKAELLMAAAGKRGDREK